MPSWLIVPDRQKITFSMSITGKCMSGAWCRSLHCHSSLWPVICDSRAIEKTFKRMATAKNVRLDVPANMRENALDQRKAREIG